MRGKIDKSEVYGCESEPIDTDSPTDNLNDNAPPRAIVSKTKPNIIKEPIFAIESSIATISIGSAIRIN